jgi:hypothetical protein
MVEYIVETLPKVKLDNVCMKFKFITRAYIVGEALYMFVLHKLLAFVVACVCRIGFDMGK